MSPHEITSEFRRRAAASWLTGVVGASDSDVSPSVMLAPGLARDQLQGHPQEELQRSRLAATVTLGSGRRWTDGCVGGWIDGLIEN